MCGKKAHVYLGSLVPSLKPVPRLVTPSGGKRICAPLRAVPNSPLMPSDNPALDGASIGASVRMAQLRREHSSRSWFSMPSVSKEVHNSSA